MIHLLHFDGNAAILEKPKCKHKLIFVLVVVDLASHKETSAPKALHLLDVKFPIGIHCFLSCSHCDCCNPLGVEPSRAPVLLDLLLRHLVER